MNEDDQSETLEAPTQIKLGNLYVEINTKRVWMVGGLWKDQVFIVPVNEPQFRAVTVTTDQLISTNYASIDRDKDVLDLLNIDLTKNIVGSKLHPDGSYSYIVLLPDLSVKRHDVMSWHSTHYKSVSDIFFKDSLYKAVIWAISQGYEVFNGSLTVIKDGGK